MDKILKLSSNSASLLDLNQIPNVISSSISTGKIKTSSQNLLTLCGTEHTVSNQNLATTNNNNKILNKDPKYMTISHTNKTKPVIASSNSRCKSRTFDNQLAETLLNSEKSNSASTFRVPSSRHFCGRLLSTNNSTNSSSSSESSSYQTNNNNNNNLNTNTKRYVSSEEEISIETEIEEDEEEEEQIRNQIVSTTSPSSASSSPNSASPPYRLNQSQRRSTDNILEHPQMIPKKQPEVILRQQQTLAKSVDYLDENEKKSLLVKKLDLQSQKNLSNILESNSKQMGLSKSIKDLRLYVSNSFSPSQIVRPPPNPPTPEPRVLDEINANLNFKKPIIMSQQGAQVINPGLLNKNIQQHMLKPLKNEKSDQVRLEFIQQQQMIARLEKQQIKEYLQHKNMGQAPLGYRERHVNDNDDALLNCILEMKPMPVSNRTSVNLQQQTVDLSVKSRSSQQYNVYNHPPQPQPRNMNRPPVNISTLPSYQSLNNQNFNNNTKKVGTYF